MNKYFSSEAVTNTQEDSESSGKLSCFTYLKLHKDLNLNCKQGFIGSEVLTTERLTITPHVTLMCVCSVQDRFKSHPFDWYL